MNAPFTPADFLDVFARYNGATRVVTFGLVILALSGVLGLLRNWRYRDRWASGVLAVLWLWSGIGYHLAFFADVNPAAMVFGLLFVVQGVSLLRRAVLRHALVFRAPVGSARGMLGLVVMAYAVAGYPLVSAALGHRWPHVPTFGAPCRVDLFTLGLLLWTSAPVPRLLLAIPLGWALVAGFAAWEFEMHEDWALVAAAAVAAVWLLPRWHEREPRREQSHHRRVSHRIWKHASKI